MTKFRVDGIPRPQGSKKHIGGGRFIEASKYLPEWRKAVIAAAKAAHTGEPLDGAITVTAEFIFPRPKALKDDQDAPPHTSPSDLDKLLRAIGDALTLAQVVGDDAQIDTWHAHKRRAKPGETPGAHITLTPSEQRGFNH